MTICNLICINLCKMTRERKSKQEAKALGIHLQMVRKGRGITLQDLEKATSVNAGQISRFEAGHFTFVSENLQNVMSFLQNSQAHREHHPQLLNRFAALLDRSPQHMAAATALITALESLQ